MHDRSRSQQQPNSLDFNATSCTLKAQSTHLVYYLMSSPFGPEDLVFSYSRKDAIRDGVLVDLSAHPELSPLIKEAGFRLPMAITDTAFGRYIELSEQAINAGQDIKGRFWDILVTLHHAIKKSDPRADTVVFQFYSVADSAKPALARLKAVVGPDDDGKPCLTLMLPEED